MAEIVNYNSLEWRSGVLALEDGSVFRGKAFGAATTVLGEAVFNTSMTGYQEVVTDPSYSGQIITMTAPQIGNYGINPEDIESDGVKVAGFIVRDLSPIASNWRSNLSLPEYLLQYGVPGLTGVDTYYNKEITCYRGNECLPEHRWSIR